MHNRSASIIDPTQLTPATNPAGGFIATYVKGPALYSGRVSVDSLHLITQAPLDTLPNRAYVQVTGILTLVRIFGDEDDILPKRAVAILDSTTGATLAIDIPRNRYTHEWGTFVEGHTVRIAGHRELDEFGLASLRAEHAWTVNQ